MGVHTKHGGRLMLLLQGLTALPCFFSLPWHNVSSVGELQDATCNSSGSSAIRG